MKRAVFLDRDGVINRALVVNGIPYPPKNLNDLEILDGVVESIAMFNAAKLEIIVVTNQPDVARGRSDQEWVEEVHLELKTKLGIENFYTCFHDDSDDCDCRKPRDGLLKRAARELQVELSKSYLVGDRWRDIGAGQSAGCCCYFIDYGYSERAPNTPFKGVSSLLEAATDIIGKT
jgi:D-glycero-D-manno-heptose 1,7-bisphosphate phosphatase